MTYLYRFIGAFFLSFILTPIVRYFSVKSSKIAEVTGDRWHSEPKALMGGVAIWCSWLLVSLSMVTDKTVLIVLIGASSIFILGLVDDLKGLSPQVKLIGQIVTVAALIPFGLVIEIIPYPVLAIPFTIFWIVGITNSFNLLDNMDGLSAGIATISSLVIGFVSIKSGNTAVAVLAFTFAGATFGFLRYNFNPATIFMGDCGSMLIGFILSSLTILGTWKHVSNLITTMAVPLLMLAIPIFDTTFVTVTRKIQGRPISQGGKDHISHRLVYLGLSEKKAVILLYAVSAILGAVSIYSNKINPLLMAAVSIIIAIGLYCLGLFLGDEAAVVPEDAIKIKKKNNRVLSKRRITEILIDITLITSAYYISYLLRYEGVIADEDMRLFVVSLPWVISIKLSIFLYMGLYRSLWKYVGIHDALDIVKSVTLSFFIIITVILMSPVRFHGYSRAIFVIDAILTVILVGGTRFMMLVFREFFASYRAKGKRILIIGAGDAGSTVLREIKHNRSLDYRVVGFVDDDPLKFNTEIYGVSVLGNTNSLSKIAVEYGVGDVVIAMPSAKKDAILKIRSTCKHSNLRYGSFPVVTKILERMNFERRSNLNLN